MDRNLILQSRIMSATCCLGTLDICSADSADVGEVDAKSASNIDVIRGFGRYGAASYYQQAVVTLKQDVKGPDALVVNASSSYQQGERSPQ